MKNKLVYKRIFCCILAVALLVCSIQALAVLLGNKGSYKQFDMFYNSDTDFDVLFLGTSHMANALNPMTLWEEQGIVSYNMAYGSCRMAHCYWLIRNALLQGQPELVVIDCGYLHIDEKYPDSSGPNHKLFNAMPLSLEKLRAIHDIFDDRQNRMRYLFPLTEYHRRWNDLKPEDFSFQPYLMGFEPLYSVGQARLYSAPRNDAAYEQTHSTRYLGMLIELCQSRDIDVLLVGLPYEANENSQRAMSYTWYIAEKYGVEYIDPDSIAAFLNTSSDFFNSYEDNSHLNLSGMLKFSRFIADYISENYQILDRREDPEYSLWHSHYESYLAILDEGMHSMTNPAEMFTLLFSGKYSAFVRLSSDTLCDDPLTIAAMENAGFDYERLLSEGCALLSDGAVLYGNAALSAPLYEDFSGYLPEDDGSAMYFSLMREGSFVGTKSF